MRAIKRRLITFSVHFPRPLLDRLDQAASEKLTSRTQVVREAVAEWLARRERQQRDEG